MTHPSPRQLLRVVEGGGASSPHHDDEAHGANSHVEAVAPSTPLLDDAEILKALREGDPKAATSLYRRVRPQVDATIRRLLGSHDAEHDDILQNTMIAIVDSIHGFRGESSLDTWVAHVTANIVFKVMRSRGSQRRMIERAQECESVIVERKGCLIEGVESRDLVQRVRAILAEMDPVKAYTVLLHDVLGYDLREIATITEASVAAAQSRLVRGRTELHERIERDPELAELLARREAR